MVAVCCRIRRSGCPGPSLTGETDHLPESPLLSSILRHCPLDVRHQTPHRRLHLVHRGMTLCTEVSLFHVLVAHSLRLAHRGLAVPRPCCCRAVFALRTEVSLFHVLVVRQSSPCALRSRCSTSLLSHSLHLVHRGLTVPRPCCCHTVFALCTEVSLFHVLVVAQSSPCALRSHCSTSLLLSCSLNLVHRGLAVPRFCCCRAVFACAPRSHCSTLLLSPSLPLVHRGLAVPRPCCRAVFTLCTEVSLFHVLVVVMQS